MTARDSSSTVPPSGPPTEPTSAPPAASPVASSDRPAAASAQPRRGAQQPPRGTRLLAVPNISEGRDRATIDAVGAAFARAGARVLDLHSDPDHHRSVFTLAGEPGTLAQAMLAGIEVAVRRIDISDGRGQHPHVGAVDVAPIVHLRDADRGAACAEALVLADMIGERLHIPALIYGELAGGRARAHLRRGGASALAQRIADGEIHPDFGPRRLHPTAGATLVAARPPLVAFNLRLAPPAGLREARAIAALIREGGQEGLPGLRAIGVALSAPATPADALGPSTAPADALGPSTAPADAVGPAAAAGAESHISPPTDHAGGSAAIQDDIPPAGQVSMNVERPSRLPLRDVVEAVRRHAALESAELVGLAPRAAFEGFPADVAIPGFDPCRHLIENALGL